MQTKSQQRLYKVTVVVPSEDGEATREVKVKAADPQTAENRALKRVSSAIRVKAVDPA